MAEPELADYLSMAAILSFRRGRSRGL